MTRAIKKLLTGIDRRLADIEPHDAIPIEYPPKGTKPKEYKPYIDREMVRLGWARVIGGFVGDTVVFGPIYDGATGDKRLALESEYRHRREWVRKKFEKNAKGARSATLKADDAECSARKLVADGQSKKAAARKASEEKGVPFQTILNRLKKENRPQ
jgi:hypothetical protein